MIEGERRLTMSKITRERLTIAFRALRKEGYTARQNFWCCQTCAWAALTEEQAERAVFYHHQDRDALNRTGRVMLAWSGDADVLRRHLEAAGHTVIHDGSRTKRIEVTADA
jgi:hypothetical protein